MVDNNPSRRRSLRDAPPLSSGFRNSRRASTADRRRNRHRSASPVRGGARSRDREREARRDYGRRYQHMKGSAKMQTTGKNVNKDTPTGQAVVPGRTSGLATSTPHADPVLVANTFQNAAHTARFMENHSAYLPDPFIASETTSAYLQPPQNIAQDPVLVNAILFESLRMVEYLQRYTASDTYPYSALENVQRYLDHLRESYPEALVHGRMESQDQTVADLGGVVVGESVTSPVADPDGSEDDGRAGEADLEWYNATWSDDLDDVAKGDI